MTSTGPVHSGQNVTSGPLLWLKSDAVGPPTDAEYTTLGVTNIADGLKCYNTLDQITYIRAGGIHVPQSPSNFNSVYTITQNPAGTVYTARPGSTYSLPTRTN